MTPDDSPRLLLWEAFSEFFLDTELTDATFRHAADAVRSSGFSMEAAEAILWNEVFPVLHVNLMSITGEWAGWSRDWLATRLQPSAGPPRRVGPGFAVQEIRRCWDEVRLRLDPES